jgi:ABC-type polysaccharide/polyol phosphate transport system ATPase subunit
MQPGQISVHDVGRRFRVNKHRNVTLKEAILRPEMRRTEEFWALRGVSFDAEPGESIGFVGRNGSGKTTLLRLIAGIFAPSTGQLEVGGTVGSLLELGAGFHPDFTGRENIFLSGSIYGLKRRYVRERLEEIVSFAELESFIDLPVRTYSSGMHMRLGFAIAVHVDADILLLDEVFAVGDEAFQRKCIGKILDFKERGGTVCFVSHSAPAVERLCERAIMLAKGEVEYDGPASEAIARYHESLALETNPEEVGAGLREWGSGEVRVGTVQLLGADGEPRVHFVSGEPVTIVLELVGERAVDAPVLSLEVRDGDGSLLGADRQDVGELGWDGAPGEHELRFLLGKLPLGEGEFQVSVALTDAAGTRQYHRVDGAVRFTVESSDHARGAVLLDGAWSLADAGRRVEAG